MQSAKIRKAMLLATLFAAGTTVVLGQSNKPPHPAKKPIILKLPIGFSIPANTLSPNGRYGVLVPDEDHWRENVSQNAIMDLKSRLMVGTIRGFTGLSYPERNHFNPSRWSSDNSLLLWEVGGKWSDHTLVLVTIRNDKIVSQLNILHIVERSIDVLTQRALRCKHSSAIIYDSYVDVKVDGNSGTRISLPLKIHAMLQSNRKGMDTERLPADSEMDALVTASGEIVVTHFKLDDD